MNSFKVFILILIVPLLMYCEEPKTHLNLVTAKDILGNPNYLALSYGGFRKKTRDLPPSVEEIKEDMRILSAMGIKVIRTYYSHKFPHSLRVLKAISALQKEDSNYEMYVMLGAWIECEGAYTAKRNHQKENLKQNTAEIEAAINLAITYPEIVKVIAVGNEAMVHWAESYFVEPPIILNYVTYLQELKKSGNLDSNLWITTSDNFASWGGGSIDYHNDDLTSLIRSVDYVSMHTYPFHDSHYNSDYWVTLKEDTTLSEIEKVDKAMLRARDYARVQYQSVAEYIKSLEVEKPIHIGETGWATSSHANYGPVGSHAADEYKQKLYYNYMREWTEEEAISCFFFEAFDEQWKDLKDERASENHFGLINLDGQAKYVLWDLVDNGVFDGLERDGKRITKTYNGNEPLVIQEVQAPPIIYKGENN